MKYKREIFLTLTLPLSSPIAILVPWFHDHIDPYSRALAVGQSTETQASAPLVVEESVPDAEPEPEKKEKRRRLKKSTKQQQRDDELLGDRTLHFF